MRLCRTILVSRLGFEPRTRGLKSPDRSSTGSLGGTPRETQARRSSTRATESCQVCCPWLSVGLSAWMVIPRSLSIADHRCELQLQPAGISHGCPATVVVEVREHVSTRVELTPDALRGVRQRREWVPTRVPADARGPVEAEIHPVRGQGLRMVRHQIMDAQRDVARPQGVEDGLMEPVRVPELHGEAMTGWERVEERDQALQITTP